MPEMGVPEPVTGLRFSNVSYSAGSRTLLHGLDFCFSPDGISAVMGPNGAGKTLMLHLAAGLLSPAKGTVSHPLQASPPHGLAILFQRPVLLRRTAIGDLTHALRIRGVARGQIASEAARLIKLANLEHHARNPARSLSGGEQQRLALARCLAGNPRILLLDEPTASLDPHNQLLVEKIIGEASRAGIKIILVTHDRDQAKRLADEVCFLNAGRLVESGAASRFFARPETMEARAYLSGEVILPAERKYT
ncbi:MAG: ATP-binding cassette domain-containing protein [Rhizobiaceae bacterium]